jgi:hypothetical protein
MSKAVPLPVAKAGNYLVRFVAEIPILRRSKKDAQPKQNSGDLRKVIARNRPKEVISLLEPDYQEETVSKEDITP